MRDCNTEIRRDRGTERWRDSTERQRDRITPERVIERPYRAGETRRTDSWKDQTEKWRERDGETIRRDKESYTERRSDRERDHHCQPADTIRGAFVSRQTFCCFCFLLIIVAMKKKFFMVSYL